MQSLGNVAPFLPPCSHYCCNGTAGAPKYPVDKFGQVLMLLQLELYLCLKQIVAHEFFISFIPLETDTTYHE